MPVSLQRFMYKLFRSILFLFPPESVHHFSMQLLKLGCRIRFIRQIIRSQFSLNDPGLQRNFLELHFINPVGLAAGFDKNALYLQALETLGFGFIEIGTVTPLPQKGNEKPRVFRLKKDQALINRMGFNNDGASIVADRLRAWKYQQVNKQKNAGTRLLIGGNIGKNKMTPNESAWTDYEACFRTLFDVVDYFVVNVSSPNTPGLRELQDSASLRKIIVHLQTINRQLSDINEGRTKPILLKIAPDLSWQQIDEVIDLAREIRLDGLVVANTTISREGLHLSTDQLQTIGAGGLSGAPLRNRSTEMIQYISNKAGGKIPIIASGGIFTAGHAKEKIIAGALLVQVWTGFIYEGPSIVKRILKGL